MGKDFGVLSSYLLSIADPGRLPKALNRAKNLDRYVPVKIVIPTADSFREASRSVKLLLKCVSCQF